jgi:CDGSH iron-sulfur domain-containing protein 3
MSDDAVVAQKGPFQVELEAGKEYWWCACGRSQTQPFCDSSHNKTTSIRPKMFVAETSGPAFLCGCKSTDDAPFCDGSHNVI